MEKEKITEAERRALVRARTQTLLVRRLSEQLRRESPDGLHSLTLDGMPRARGGIARGLDAQMAKREALQSMAARESALMREYEREARSAMDRMGPEDYAFCALYYLAALSLGEVAEAMDRSERQCLRYKRRIEGEE